MPLSHRLLRQPSTMDAIRTGAPLHSHAGIGGAAVDSGAGDALTV
jgi:hypothetical protein